ncbi:MAG TPA: cytochrome c oxidase assembly protein [Steroidobacteraceae bacterium]|jgi:putative membrane protein
MTGASAHIPYCGSPPFPGDLWHRFNLDPILIAALIVLLLLHLRALRTEPDKRFLAIAGWLVAAAALLSPLCALSVSLFSARVAQHMLLLLVAAPLVAMAWPKAVTARHIWPLWASAALFLVALWFWHMPIPYDATFQSTSLYWSMHVTLFGSGILLWRELLQHRDAHTLDVLAAALLSSLQMGLLGAVLTFAARPLYLSHLATAGLWGYTPLQDQQLGGVLMWVPGVGLFLWASVRSLRRLWMALDSAEPS